jgi:hypothetical protein
MSNEVLAAPRLLLVCAILIIVVIIVVIIIPVADVLHLFPSTIGSAVRTSTWGLATFVNIAALGTLPLSWHSVYLHS